MAVIVTLDAAAQHQRRAVIGCGGVGGDEAGPRGLWQRAPVGIAGLGGDGVAGRLADRADGPVHDVCRLCDQRLRQYRAAGVVEDSAFEPSTRSDGSDPRRLACANRSVNWHAIARCWDWRCALSVLLFAINGIRQFEPVFLDQLGAGETIIGLASTIGAMVELPAMLWVDRLGRRHGSGQLLRMSFLLYAVCALSVVIAPTIPVILFSHVIDGVAYSFFAVALVLFIGEVAPDRQVTMMMAVFTVTLPAIIRMVSAPVGGWVFDVRGAYALYIIGVIGAAVGWLIMKVMVKDRRVQE